MVEDAWITHDDLIGSGLGMKLGQFQDSDLMFPRETRLTAQDFIPYRTASYYFMRNVKGIIEVNVDFQGKDNNPSDGFGHDSKEGYALLGFDTAF